MPQTLIGKSDGKVVGRAYERGHDWVVHDSQGRVIGYGNTRADAVMGLLSLGAMEVIQDPPPPVNQYVQLAPVPTPHEQRMRRVEQKILDALTAEESKEPCRYPNPGEAFVPKLP